MYGMWLWRCCASETADQEITSVAKNSESQTAVNLIRGRGRQYKSS